MDDNKRLHVFSSNFQGAHSPHKRHIKQKKKKKILIK